MAERSALDAALRHKHGLGDVLRLMAGALSGDMVFVVKEATVSTVHTGSAWTRTVHVELQNAAGEIQTWFTKDITSGVSVGDAGGGTASIPSTTLSFVEGKASVVVSGTAATWAADETDTLTVAAFTCLGYVLASKTSVETFT